MMGMHVCLLSESSPSPTLLSFHLSRYRSPNISLRHCHHHLGSSASQRPTPNRHIQPSANTAMVKVEIVEEKDQQAANSPYASSASSRTSSSVSLSSVDSDSPVDESLLDRISALKDIVPPTTRHSIAAKVSKSASVFKRTTKILGNVIWVVTTSALLIGLPLALILEDEAKVVAQENEMLAQQQGAQQVCIYLPFSTSFPHIFPDGIR